MSQCKMSSLAIVVLFFLPMVKNKLMTYGTVTGANMSMTQARLLFNCFIIIVFLKNLFPCPRFIQKIVHDGGRTDFWEICVQSSFRMPLFTVQIRLFSAIHITYFNVHTCFHYLTESTCMFLSTIQVPAIMTLANGVESFLCFKTFSPG